MHNAPPDKNPPRMDANGLGAGVRAALEKFLFETTRGHGLILQWPEGPDVLILLCPDTVCDCRHDVPVCPYKRRFDAGGDRRIAISMPSAQESGIQ